MMTSAIGHSYLISRNYILNGGIFTEFISQVKFSNSSTPSTIQFGSIDLGQYIKNYFLNSTKSVPVFNSYTNLITNYENVYNSNLITTSFGLIYLTCPFLFCFLFYLFWMLWQVIKINPTFQGCYFKSSPILPWKSKLYTADDSIAIFTEKEIQNRRKVFLDKILIYSSICGMLIIAYIISFTFAISSQISLTNKLQSNTDNNSLISSWKQASQNIESLFNFILIDGQQIFNQSINIISISIQKSLTNSLNRLITDLLKTFGVISLFTILSDLLSNLNVTVNSMTYIATNSKSTLGDIDILLGKLQAYRSTLHEYISSVCVWLVDQSQCQRYLKESEELNVPIVTKNINTDSSINMLFILKQFSLNLTQLTSQVQNLQMSFNQTLQTLTKEKVDEMNVAKSIDSIRSYWKYVSNFVLPMQIDFRGTSTSVSNTITQIITSIIAINIVLLSFIFLTMLYSLYSISRYSIMYYFEKVILIDEINAPSPRPIFVLHHLKKLRVINKLKNFHLSSWIIYTYFIFYSWILIILILICILSISIGEILYNETCTQFWNSNGLKNTDKIFDSFLTSQWVYINATIAASNLPIPLNLTKPEKIMQSIQNNCINDTGLLEILKWSDSINISSLVWNNQNLEVLKSGLNLTYDAIIKINTQNLVPSDMNTFLTSVKTVSKYFDEVNYTITIDELSKNVIQMKNLSQWINDSMGFFTQTNTPDTPLVLRTLNNIQLLLPTISNLQSLVNTLNYNYKLIQQRQINGVLIEQLLSGLDKIKTSFQSSPETYKVVSDAYSIIMLKDFTTITDIFLTNEAKLTLNKLFPCQFLSKTLTLILNNICNDNQILEIFVSNGLIHAILSGVLILLFHFHWILIRLDLNENSEKNVSIC